GRLTLNVLLSFAQFEREVTGERIRDKIAASKRKGMWMGGLVPLGYDVRDQKLVINPSEAETVRQIFQRYCNLAAFEFSRMNSIEVRFDRIIASRRTGSNPAVIHSRAVPSTRCSATRFTSARSVTRA